MCVGGSMGDPTISETISVLSYCQNHTNVMLIKAHECDAY